MDKNLPIKIGQHLKETTTEEEWLVKVLRRCMIQEEVLNKSRYIHAQLQSHLIQCEKNIQQLQIDVMQQEAVIFYLERQEEDARNGTYEGNSFNEITDYSQKKAVERSGSPCIDSIDFFTGAQGYKMCAKIYLNGEGSGKGTHLSVILVLKNGPFDCILPWPFKGCVTFTLLNQDNKDPLRHEQSFLSSQRATKEISVLSAIHKFAPHKVIEKFEEGFLRNDKIAITVKVDLF